MPIYRCRFLGSADHSVTTKIVDCETDDEVQETADSLLASCDYSGVVIWDRGRQVNRARKTDAPTLLASDAAAAARRRILDAIERLQAKAPAEGEKVH